MSIDDYPMYMQFEKTFFNSITQIIPNLICVFNDVGEHTFKMNLNFFRLSNVTLETAIFISGSKNNLAIGVEVCQCPEMYEGTSCQNPADGYYRYKETMSETSHMNYEILIGKSVKCECNNRSNRCDKETGYCEVNNDHA